MAKESFHRELQQEKASIYGDIKYESERRKIVADYEDIEAGYNDFLDKKIGVDEFAKKLGNHILGIAGEHGSAQIYAFELLNKSLAEAKTDEEKGKIIEEALFDIASEELPVKKEYLLGILAYFTSASRHHERSERFAGEPNNAQLQDEAKIYGSYHGSLENLGDKRRGLTPEMMKILELISNDFPPDSEDGAVAQLVANYYAKEEHPTTPPNPSSSRILDQLHQYNASHGETGNPERVYVLPPGYHTSREKIEEAKIWGIPLYTSLARIQSLESGEKTKTALIFNISEAEGMKYIDDVRTHEDEENWAGAEKVREEYKQRLWDSLDENTKRAFGGDPNELIILVQTIRDESLDVPPEKAKAESAA